MLLTGDGQGNFHPGRVTESGLYADGGVKGEASIIVGDQLVYLFARNNGRLIACRSQPTGYSFHKIDDPILKARVVYKDSTVKTQEFYQGSSYLSQSSCKLRIHGEISEIFLFDHSGNETKYLYSNHD